MSAANHDVTTLLHLWSQGDPTALERLMPLVIEELRKIAQRYLAKENREHTLQPTALVNELYLKLNDRRTVNWQNRAQFFGVAAEMMRRILVDYARARHTAKRGKGSINLSLDDSFQLPDRREEEILALDDALKALAVIDPQQAKIVELRYFTGLTNEEIADILGVSETTVKRDWRHARLWLAREIRKD